MADDSDGGGGDASGGDPIRITAGGKGTDPADAAKAAMPGPREQSSMVKSLDSQQIDEAQFHSADIDTYKPPYQPDQLSRLLELNETHAVSCRKKAAHVAGFGFDLAPHPEVADSEHDDPPGRDPVEDFWFGRESKFQIGPNGTEPATPAEVLERAWLDYEAIGWLALEVLTADTDNTPMGLAHVPAQTIRKRTDGRGYVQIGPDMNKRYFGRFGMRYDEPIVGVDGSQEFVDSESGEIGETVADVDEVANELLVINKPSLSSLHYGTPDIIPALQTLEGDEAAKRYNVDFFENNAVPRFAVLIEGATVSDELRRSIEQAFVDLKGEGGNNRTLVIDAEPADTVANEFEAADADGDVNITLEPLTVGVEEDASFQNYRDSNEHTILQVHEVPPVIAGRTEDINRTTAQEQRRHFAEEVVGPKQERLAERLYQTLHVVGLGVENWTLSFELRGAETRQRDANVAQTRVQAANGSMTIDEARSELGLEPLGAPLGEMLLGEAFEPKLSDLANITQDQADVMGGGGSNRPAETPPDAVEPVDAMRAQLYSARLDGEADD